MTSGDNIAPAPTLGAFPFEFLNLSHVREDAAGLSGRRGGPCPSQLPAFRGAGNGGAEGLPQAPGHAAGLGVSRSKGRWLSAAPPHTHSAGRRQEGSLKL